MELAPHVETLRRELKSLTRFAPEEMARAVAQLTEAIEAPVRLTLLEVLSAAAAEITERLDDVVVDLRLSGGEPEFVVTSKPGAAGPATEREAAGQDNSQDDSGTVRITLRLSESVKSRVESAASSAGLSINAWLAHAAIRALTSTSSGAARSVSIGQRISGYARS